MNINITLTVILLALLLSGIALLFLIRSSRKEISENEFIQKIQRVLDKSVTKNIHIPHGQIKLIAPSKNVDMTWSTGTEKNDSFHVASVGKIFTAVLVARLVEQGKTSWDKAISDYLGEKLLSGVFDFDGTDYSQEVTISHLLNHTSGCADYFEDDAAGGSVKDLVISDPQKHWTPVELVRFTGENQNPLGIPGKQFHYSDTGYILLGLILEKVYGKGLHEIMEDEIFQPLNMKDTSMSFFPSEKSQILGTTILDGVDVSSYKSLSADWAGGGLISTLDDLALFGQALMDGRIIQSSTLKKMFSFDEKFMRGIHYGLGLMEYHFGEFFPTLKGLPKMKGHMGILGTQLMMDFEKGTVLVINYSSTHGAAESVRTAIQILSLLQNLEG